MQILILGMTGTGKTYRTWETIKLLQARYPHILYVDPTYNYSGVESIRQVNFQRPGTHILNVDNSEPVPFKELTDYLFEESLRYQRFLLVVDECDLFCMSSSEDCDRITTKSRRFFDVIWITQRPSLCRTISGYTIFTQSQHYLLFFMRDRDYDTIAKHSGIDIDPETKEWLKTQYNYVFWNGREWVKLRGSDKCPEG